MAITQTVIRRTIFGDRRIVYGTYSIDTTGGTIETGLHLVQHFDLQHTGSAAVAEFPSVNETLPCTGSVKIVCTSGKNGLWRAIGF